MMGTIDDLTFKKAGAAGCSNSDFNLGITGCCRRHVVEDRELGDIYFDPKDLSRRVSLLDKPACPFCGAAEWAISLFAEWPKERTEWMWASHWNAKIVEDWRWSG